MVRRQSRRPGPARHERRRRGRVLEAVILAARFHHEKYDGSGYPNGLKGPQIPRTARILAVCDTWDALTTDRPYRKAFEASKAKMILLERSESDFDPEIVSAFVATLVES